ncbi:MAG TPA: hypothetical protein VNO51_18170 [Ilumatobacteraceae bacterium]|nr:hypothetical protein [Ilumatobacteraceae bacterium]
MPEPGPQELVAPSLLRGPAPDELVEFSVLPEPAPQEVVVPVVVAQAPPATLLETTTPHEATAPSPDVVAEPRPGVLAPAEPLDRWLPPAVSVPPRTRTSPRTLRQPVKPERAAPSGPRRFLVGLVAVVLGASCVVAIRTFVGDDDDDADTVLSTPTLATQTSIVEPGGATPAASEPPASATTLTTPAVSVTTPVVPGSAAPDTATTIPTNPVPATIAPTAPTEPTTATTVPVATPSTDVPPAPGTTRLSGVGNDVIDLAGVDIARKIMVVSHNGVADFELSTLDQELNLIVLLESTVGAVTGTYGLGFEGEVVPRYLRVDADGQWVIDIKPVEEARLWQADFITGVGADVLRFEGAASVLDYTNAGSSNFIVRYHRESGFDLLVNEIGPISGSTTMQAGPGIVIIDAVGDWALSARPA